MTGAYARGAAGLLLALAVAGVSPLGAASSYLVSGVVVDSRSHAPLGNARVSLAPTTARDRKLEQVTGQDGRFSFPVIEPGKYSLAMAKPGYAPQSYKQAGFEAVSSAIVVRDGQDTAHLVFEASRGSVISGLVKDEDSEPVGHALVAIFQSAVAGGERRIVARGQTRANAVGEFRFFNLPRGNYYLCAMGHPWFADSLMEMEEIPRAVARARAAVRAGSGGETDQPAPKFSPDPGFRGTAFPTTFYPDARSVEQAAPIRLETGGEAQVSVALPLTRAVSVRGTLGVPGEIGDGRATLYNKVYEGYVPFLTAWVQKDRTFQFKNVPPGSYEIVASSQAASGATSWSVREEVEVGASDLEVTLRPQQMGSLSGRVLLEGEGAAPTGSLFVSLHDENNGLSQAEVRPDASFSLSRLPAGRYEVTAGNTDYIAASFIGPAGERLPLTLTISSGETVRRDLTLTRAVSVIEGTVEKDGTPQIGAFVLLMPKDSSRQWAYRVDQTDSDGSYRLATIPSGDYFLIALSDGNDVAYRDPKVASKLSKAAKLVHLDPGDRLNLPVDVVSTADLNLSSP
jgi:hypothetical protein